MSEDIKKLYRLRESVACSVATGCGLSKDNPVTLVSALQELGDNVTLAGAIQGWLQHNGYELDFSGTPDIVEMVDFPLGFDDYRIYTLMPVKLPEAIAETPSSAKEEVELLKSRLKS